MHFRWKTSMICSFRCTVDKPFPTFYIRSTKILHKRTSMERLDVSFGLTDELLNEKGRFSTCSGVITNSMHESFWLRFFFTSLPGYDCREWHSRPYSMSFDSSSSILRHILFSPFSWYNVLLLSSLPGIVPHSTSGSSYGLGEVAGSTNSVSGVGI